MASKPSFGPAPPLGKIKVAGNKPAHKKRATTSAKATVTVIAAATAGGKAKRKTVRRKAAATSASPAPVAPAAGTAPQGAIPPVIGAAAPATGTPPVIAAATAGGVPPVIQATGTGAAPATTGTPAATQPAAQTSTPSIWRRWISSKTVRWVAGVISIIVGLVILVKQFAPTSDKANELLVNELRQLRKQVNQQHTSSTMDRPAPQEWSANQNLSTPLMVPATPVGRTTMMTSTTPSAHRKPIIITLSERQLADRSQPVWRVDWDVKPDEDVKVVTPPTGEWNATLTVPTEKAVVLADGKAPLEVSEGNEWDRSKPIQTVDEWTVGLKPGVNSARLRVTFTRL